MKPYITTFAFSDDVKEQPQPNGNRTLDIINPQNLFRPLFIPGTYTFSVTFGLLGIDPNTSHKLDFQIKHSEVDEEALVNIEGADLAPNLEFLNSGLPNEANGFIFNMDFRNLPFRHEGKYIATVSLDGLSLGEFPLLVYPLEKI